MKKLERAGNPDTVDLTLFVRTSDEEIVRWNRQRIVDALIRETDIDDETADAVSREVEKQLMNSGISLLTSTLIREMVDAKLIERGLEHARGKHARLGFPLYDVGQLILHPHRGNANLPHNPEATNLILAEGIKRAYGLHEVFSREVGDAHAAGDLHIHALGYIDRPYSICSSLEYVKKFGINLPHSVNVAGPARHGDVLLAHMVRYAAILQGHFSGVVAWHGVNYFFAPYLAGMTEDSIRQLAQMFVYEFAQLASATGGQSIFTDIHLSWEVPEYLADVQAIGPGGEKTGKRYGEYLLEAQRFLWALFDVYREGDAAGQPFVFPRPIVHLSEGFFRTPGWEAFLEHLCDVAADKGNPFFVFDRGGLLRLSECGSLPLGRSPSYCDDVENPERMRNASMQNISLNLPRLAYRAEGDSRRLMKLLTAQLELAVTAHVQKKVFIEKLLNYGDSGPLSLMTMNRDGHPYLRPDRTAYLVGMVGLNELVRISSGKHLHESSTALKLGLKIVGHMKKEIDRFSRKYGLRLILEQSPAETTAYRFARLDLRYFSPEAGRHIRGDVVRGGLYYNNSTHLDVSAKMRPLERVRQEGLFHSFLEGSALTNLRLAEERPAKEALAAFLRQVFFETQSAGVVFSSDFTTCPDCRKTVRGFHETCPHCGEKSVKGLARITRYYSLISGWNKGKLAELGDCYRTSSNF
ncbi:ribonucleoside-triphosphate reductase class III catalytic subunit [Syntrophus gentianae]|uniref:Ribonucleoside-triphosphate reductase class III catalytic subunit n=1 Tax=Syntrophus gentianae TaxID=43775 RepID=A0A1H7ZJD6_9BACT|nr:anaerobic ribonucleoside-triphosphate reductase [Syntrophus gentianae]SEM58064.1 ribonucleoside-triphosphate reductase class III catalytic subunit [Syntrophus gentianae]